MKNPEKQERFLQLDNKIYKNLFIDELMIVNSLQISIIHFILRIDIKFLIAVEIQKLKILHTAQIFRLENVTFHPTNYLVFQFTSNNKYPVGG